MALTKVRAGGFAANTVAHVPITTVTAGSSTSNLDWTGASSAYDKYLVFYHITPTADADIRMRFFDSSNSIVSSSSYGYGTTNEASSNNGNSNGTSAISLRVTHGGAGTNEDMTGWFYFINPKVSTKRTGVTIWYNGENSSGNHIAGMTLGAFTSEAEHNGFRLFVASGNLDGSTAQIYGILNPS